MIRSLLIRTFSIWMAAVLLPRKAIRSRSFDRTRPASSDDRLTMKADPLSCPWTAAATSKPPGRKFLEQSFDLA